MAASNPLDCYPDERVTVLRGEVRETWKAEGEIERLRSELSDAQAQIQGLAQACRDASNAMIGFCDLLNWPDWIPASYLNAMSQLRAWADYAEGKEQDPRLNRFPK